MAKRQQELMTTTQVAEILDRDPRTIQRWAKSGQVPATKLHGTTATYVFNRADIDALITSPAVAPSLPEIDGSAAGEPLSSERAS